MSTQAKEILAKASMRPLALMDNPDLNIPVKDALEAMQEYADLKTQELQQEVEALKRWKQEALEVWGPIVDWGHAQKDIPLGTHFTSEVLKRLNDYQQLKERAGKMEVALEKIKWLCAGHHEVHNDNISKIWEAGNEALASWKEDQTNGGSG